MLVGPWNLLLPAGVKQNGSDVFNILDPDSGGAATFSVRLSVGGLEPVTWWGARTMPEPATVDALRTMTTTEFKAHIDALAIQRGRTPVGSITAFKNALLMSEGDFWAFCAAQGLSRVALPL